MFNNSAKAAAFLWGKNGKYRRKLLLLQPNQEKFQLKNNKVQGNILIYNCLGFGIYNLELLPDL